MAHLLIAVADYYEDVTDALQEGVAARLAEDGHQSSVITVPGAFELPAAIQMAVDSATQYDGYIALGCVIRGETTHYDYVCQQCMRGLQDIALTQNLALGVGVLTVETKDQAMARAAIDGKNKGGEAAEACLQMLQIQQRFGL